MFCRMDMECAQRGHGMPWLGWCNLQTRPLEGIALDTCLKLRKVLKTRAQDAGLEKCVEACC